MDKQALKTDLIEWLKNLKDPKTLNELKHIKESHDWWEFISEAEKDAIEEGISQLEKGEAISHELLMKEAREKYGS